MAARTTALATAGQGGPRVHWLDGIREGTAMFLVLHHIGLTTWSDFPSTGPWCAPIVGVLNKYAFGPLELAPLATFGVSFALGLSVVLALSYGVHLLFEAQFLRHRDPSAIRTMSIVRMWIQPQRRGAGRRVAGADELSGATIVPARQPATAERAVG